MNKQFDVLMQKYDEGNWGEPEEDSQESEGEEQFYRNVELDAQLVEAALNEPGTTNAMIAGKLDTVVRQVPVTPEEAASLPMFRKDASGLPKGQLVPFTKSVFELKEEARNMLPVVDPEITRKLALATLADDNDDEPAWIVDDKPEQKWDCESIVSTYSNLEHHPTIIQVAKKSKSKESVDKPVQLSRKTGMPVFEEEEDNEDDEAIDDAMSTTSIVIAPRRKGETKEEKKRRKAEAKARARARRAEKKMNKMSFKAERKRISKSSANADQYRTRFKY